MLEFIVGIFGYMGSDLQKTKSKKTQFFISLAFGFCIFIAICINEFFANADSRLVFFAITLSLSLAALIFICFMIANFFRK